MTTSALNLAQSLVAQVHQLAECGVVNLHAMCELDRLESNLAQVKRHHIINGSDEAKIQHIDKALNLPLLSSRKRYRPIPASLCALLPYESVQHIFSTGVEVYADKEGAHLVHQLVDLISNRTVNPAKQSDLFEEPVSCLTHLLALLRLTIKTFPQWLDMTDEDGNTPLACSVYLMAVDAIPILLAAGANTQIINKHGYRALDIQEYVHFVQTTPSIPERKALSQRVMRLMEAHICTEESKALMKIVLPNGCLPTSDDKDTTRL